jgi:hypothetical protein
MNGNVNVILYLGEITGAVFIAVNAQPRYIIKSMLNIISGRNPLNGWYLFARIATTPFIIEIIKAQVAFAHIPARHTCANGGK